MTAAQKKPKLLIVEDEPLTRWFLRDVLRVDGYLVEEAGTAEQAILMLEERGYQAVVTDIEMPGDLNGLDLAWAVAVRWPQTGVVITSGQTLPAPKDMPPRAKFVAKPIHMAVLLQAVGEVIKA